MFGRFSLHVLIVAYLVLTLCAFSYTLTRRSILPLPMVRYFYGMMAPFQGYHPMNTELHVEGLRRDGTWETVDLRPLIPGGLGEFTYREYNMVEKPDREVVKEKRRRQFAEQLLAMQRTQGSDYRAVRFFWRQWPKSPLGFYALKREPFTNDQFLFEVP